MGRFMLGWLVVFVPTGTMLLMFGSGSTVVDNGTMIGTLAVHAGVCAVVTALLRRVFTCQRVASGVQTALVSPSGS